MHAKLGGLVALAAASISVSAAAEEFTFAFGADVQTFDPHTFNETFTIGFLGNFYEGLTRRDADLAIQPALAESWEMVEPTRWRFHLRQGVTFHDGSDFTAEDVVFSFERAGAETSDVDGRLANITEVVAVDDYTVEMVTETPNPILTAEFDGLYIMDSGWAEAHDALLPTDLGAGEESYATRNINGTGAYRLVSREPDIRTEAAANADWWGAATLASNADPVIFQPIASDATRVAALLSGEVDMIYPLPLQDIERIDSTDGVRALVGPEIRGIMLGFDHEREVLNSNGEPNPFGDVAVRQALYQAIDIEAIRTVVMRDLAYPLAILAAPEINGGEQPQIERYPYDPEAARDLLAEAGYPDGFSMELVCPNDRYVNDDAICQAVVGMFDRIGVDASLTALTRSQWAERVVNYDFDMFMLGWSPSSLDAWNVLFNLTRTDGSNNWGHFSNPELDALIDAIISETDDDARAEQIAEAWAMVHEDIPWLPLHQQSLVWAVRDGVEVAQRANNVLTWSDVTVE